MNPSALTIRENSKEEGLRKIGTLSLLLGGGVSQEPEERRDSSSWVASAGVGGGWGGGGGLGGVGGIG